MIKAQFKALGFSEKEINIYLCLAKQGEKSATSLSHLVQVSRTSIYPLLRGLIEKGLVSKSNVSGADTFIANDPSALLTIAINERAQLLHKEGIIKQLIQHVSPLFQPLFQLYEGPENIKNMLTEIKTDNSNNNTLYCYQDSSFDAHYKSRLGQHIQTINIALDLDCSLWVNNNTIRMVQSRTEPHYAILIRDIALAGTLKTIFKLINSDYCLKNNITSSSDNCEKLV